MTMLFCNGQLADAGALSAALVNYGHFTSLQVRGSAVQGLALHLERLQQGTRELFDSELDCAQVAAWLRQALHQLDAADASVRITVFSHRFDFRQPLRAVPVDVLIAIAAPATIPALARSVLPMPYQRELAHIKHVGTFPLFSCAGRQCNVALMMRCLSMRKAASVKAAPGTWRSGTACRCTGRRLRRCVAALSVC